MTNQEIMNLTMNIRHMATDIHHVYNVRMGAVNNSGKPFVERAGQLKHIWGRIERLDRIWDIAHKRWNEAYEGWKMGIGVVEYGREAK